MRAAEERMRVEQHTSREAKRRIRAYSLLCALPLLSSLRHSRAFLLLRGLPHANKAAWYCLMDNPSDVWAAAQPIIGNAILQICFNVRMRHAIRSPSIESV
jgi:hypothetical protein